MRGAERRACRSETGVPSRGCLPGGVHGRGHLVAGRGCAVAVRARKHGWGCAVRGAERRACRSETGVPSRGCLPGGVHGRGHLVAGRGCAVAVRARKHGWGCAVRGAERRACRSETGVPSRGCLPEGVHGRGHLVAGRGCAVAVRARKHGWGCAVRGAERRACRSETGVPSRGCLPGGVHGRGHLVAGRGCAVAVRARKHGWGCAVRGAERRACRSETGVPSRGCLPGGVHGRGHLVGVKPGIRGGSFAGRQPAMPVGRPALLPALRQAA